MGTENEYGGRPDPDFEGLRLFVKTGYAIGSTSARAYIIWYMRLMEITQ